VVHTYNPSTWELRQEDWPAGNIVRPYLKIMQRALILCTFSEGQWCLRSVCICPRGATNWEGHMLLNNPDTQFFTTLGFNIIRSGGLRVLASSLKK
jgi:hypothetical protein